MDTTQVDELTACVFLRFCHPPPPGGKGEKEPRDGLCQISPPSAFYLNQANGAITARDLSFHHLSPARVRSFCEWHVLGVVSHPIAAAAALQGGGVLRPHGVQLSVLQR